MIYHLEYYFEILINIDQGHEQGDKVFSDSRIASLHRSQPTSASAFCLLQVSHRKKQYSSPCSCP